MRLIIIIIIIRLNRVTSSLSNRNKSPSSDRSFVKDIMSQLNNATFSWNYILLQHINILVRGVRCEMYSLQSDQRGPECWPVVATCADCADNSSRHWAPDYRYYCGTNTRTTIYHLSSLTTEHWRLTVKQREGSFNFTQKKSGFVQSNAPFWTPLSSF